MSGAYPLFAVLAIAVKATKEREEKAHYNVMKNLDDIVRDGIDLTVWNVNTNVSGLPESLNLFWLREHYKRPSESSSEYLRRVFETIPFSRVRFDKPSIFYPFAFYEDSDGHLIAKRRNSLSMELPVPALSRPYRNNFSLVFVLSQPEIKAQTREVVLFRPVRTDLPKIVREIEVRQHRSEVLYSEFLGKNPQLDDKKRVHGVYKVNFKD